MMTEQELEDSKLHEIRLDILIEEFEKLKDGYVRMDSWVAGVDEDNIQEAVDNPCGTAACIAGKAGLMRRFHEMGFQWKPGGRFSISKGWFSISPSAFFGRPLYVSVLSGFWAMHRIHTPQQAVLALKAFRKDMQERPALVREWGHYWEPDEDTRKMVSAMDPDWKTFPVSGDDYREKVV